MQYFPPGVGEMETKERHDTPQMSPNGLCQFPELRNPILLTQLNPLQEELPGSGGALELEAFHLEKLDMGIGFGNFPVALVKELFQLFLLAFSEFLRFFHKNEPQLLEHVMELVE